MSEKGMISLEEMRNKRSEPPVLTALGLLYMIGAFVGAVYGNTLFTVEEFQVNIPSFRTLISYYSLPCFVALWCSVSSVGWVIIPIIFFSRGFSSGSGMIAALNCGVVMKKAFALTALPAFVSVFPLLSITETSFHSSLMVRDGILSGTTGEKKGFGDFIISTTAVCFGAVFTEQILIRMI